MFLHQKFIPLIITILVASSTRAKELNSTSCSAGKLAGLVSYAFGFSESSPIKLNCTDNGQIQIGQFPVQNITRRHILVNVPPKCNRSTDSVKALFADNYRPTRRNSFLVRNCTPPLTDCVIPTSFVSEKFEWKNCEAKSHDLSCFSQSHELRHPLMDNIGNLTQCKFLVSSVVVESALNSAISLAFQTIELEWWLNAPCRCSTNAICENVMVPEVNGFRCQCKEGFEGDGFADGTGCRKVSGCNASNYISGRCKGRANVGVLVGGIIAGTSLLAGLALVCDFIRRRSNCSKRHLRAKRLLSEAAGNSSVPLYPYRDIERATNNFSDKQGLGTGAFGTVYAGKLNSEDWVAIKRIKHRDHNSIDQVMNEIKLLSSVSHPNLVRLLGCCIEEGQQILVYEFMPNGTLSQHLQRERGKGIPWTTRLTIATETAQAIAYLHSAMHPPIYHRDIKSSNILLDYNFKSKVADFGLSRLGMTESSHISTAPQGTPGYLDPQYHQNFHLSDKSDVYSFGVVLVEIITALKVVDFNRPQSEINLAALAIDRIGRDCVDEIIDPFLEPNRDAWTLYSVHKVAELAFRCLAFHSDMRPSMMEVAEELENIKMSGWQTLEENICVGSSIVSHCSSPRSESEKSLGGLSESKKSIRPPENSNYDCMASAEQVKDSSTVSVQDPWLSEQSSPSANSLLNNVIH